MQKLREPALLWSWVFNGVRIMSAIILAPLLWRCLGNADFGMFGVLTQIALLVPIVDFGFSASIGRFVSYAMGGAKEIQAQGMGGKTAATGPNYELLWSLLLTTRRLYRWMSLLALILAGIFGTAWIADTVAQTSNPRVTWIAWGVTLLSVVMEVYFSWWNTFLMGMNEVLCSSRLGGIAQITKLVLAAVLLLSGMGLLALPIATLVSSTLLRYSARGRCLKLLGQRPKPRELDTTSLLRKMWPNSWRLGVLYLSSYIRNTGIAFTCTKLFNLEGYSAFSLSFQMVMMIQSLSYVWTLIKWPSVGQALARHDYGEVRELLRPRFIAQFATYLVMLAMMLPAAPFCAHLFSKQVLPLPFLAVMGLNAMLELHFTFWTTLLSMENRLPFLWPTVVSNLCSLGVAVVLLKTTSLGVSALVIAPALIGSMFNYWYWASPGAAVLKTNWLSFIMHGTRVAAGSSTGKKTELQT